MPEQLPCVVFRWCLSLCSQHLTPQQVASGWWLLSGQLIRLVFPRCVYVCPFAFQLKIKSSHQVFSSKAGSKGVCNVSIHFNKAKIRRGLFLTGAEARFCEAGSTIIFQAGSAPQMKKLPPVLPTQGACWGGEDSDGRCRLPNHPSHWLARHSSAFTLYTHHPAVA